MKAMVLKGVKNLVVEDVAVPKPADDEVLLKVAASGVCGTDVHMWAGINAEGSFPFIPGHETVGRVVEVGKKVSTLKVGDRVTGEPFIACRVCAICRNGGPPAACPHHRYYGFTKDTGGGFAEYQVSPEERLFKVPDDISDDTAALTEPIAVAYHAVWGRAGGAAPHDRIGIFGTGPIGLFAMSACLVSGAQVIVVEPSPYRQKMAANMGAEVIIDPRGTDSIKEIMDLTEGLGFTKIIECSGNPSAIATAVNVIAVDGKIVLTGHPGVGVSTELGKLIWTHASIVGSCDSPHFFPKTLAFISRGLVDFEKAISHRFSLDAGEEPFALGNKGTESSKIMIYPAT